MEQAVRLRLAGSSRAFTTVFKGTLEDCGFNTVLNDGTEPERFSAREVFVYEIRKKADILSLPERKEPEPFLIFTQTAIGTETVDRLKEGGLVGVITSQTAPEEIAFLVNAAFFYTRMLKRNPRVPVSIPVDVKAGSRVMKTTSSTLSRDGIFVVTLNPLPADTVCELTFEAPLSGKRLTTKARVLYNIAVNKDLNIISSPGDPFKRIVTHPGMALLFADLPEEDRELLESYIKTVR
ncbi:MAG: PilZ domain-containing protein [Deltaproteobacteria bacterium]|nr:PilZ domain-containing protein [Deltaproteobacteria bacterium]